MNGEAKALLLTNKKARKSVKSFYNFADKRYRKTCKYCHDTFRDESNYLSIKETGGCLRCEKIRGEVARYGQI